MIMLRLNEETNTRQQSIRVNRILNSMLKGWARGGGGAKSANALSTGSTADSHARPSHETFLDT